MSKIQSAALIALVMLAGCANDPPEAGTNEFAATIQQVQVPAEFTAGETAFNQNCAACHGERGLGTDQGPPLINMIYEPNHHGDMAFFMAASRGVQAHHWNFGNMPPLPQVSTEEMQAIVPYIRFLQRQVGIM